MITIKIIKITIVFVDVCVNNFFYLNIFLNLNINFIYCIK